MKRLAVVSLVATIASFTGCSTPPPRVDAASLTECRQIDSEVVRVRADRRAAEEKKDGAWKSVTPFVVVGQYIEGKQDVAAADQQLAALSDQAAHHGCTS